MILKDVATVSRLKNYTKNQIGEKIPNYEDIAVIRLRLYDTQSQYVRTETGFIRLIEKEAIVDANNILKHGDRIRERPDSDIFQVTGIIEDGLGIWSKVKLKLVVS